ncbi:hypothetical protein [Haloglycomyces albus]|uniref:hypothetical protein n=1 Tax=Haloglycomyces albus TaxID=526067 RepID=UPI0004AF33FD|nr:hypothetical protein [Haloglycomyces albus]
MNTAQDDYTALFIMGPIIALVALGLGFMVVRGAMHGHRLKQGKKGLETEGRYLPGEAQRRGWQYAPRDDRALTLTTFGSVERATPAGSPQPGSTPQRSNDSSQDFGLGFVFANNPTTAAEHVMNFSGNFGQYTIFQHRYNDATRTMDERYVYEEKPAEANYRSVFAVRLPTVTPFLYLTRRSRTSVDFLSYDIKVENHRFNKNYFVFGHSRRFASDIVHPRFVEWIVGSEFDLGTRFVLHNGWCLVTFDRILRAHELDAGIGALEGFRSHIPDFAWEMEYQG